MKTCRPRPTSQYDETCSSSFVRRFTSTDNDFVGTYLNCSCFCFPLGNASHSGCVTSCIHGSTSALPETCQLSLPFSYIPVLLRILSLLFRGSAIPGSEKATLERENEKALSLCFPVQGLGRLLLLIPLPHSLSRCIQRTAALRAAWPLQAVVRRNERRRTG